MSDSNKDLHIAIIEYLQQLAQNPGSLDADSIEVAAQCLAESLQVDLYSSDVQPKLLATQATDLQKVFSAGLNGGAADATPVKKAEDVTEDDKTQAEAFKNTGNQKLNTDPAAAVEEYTKAIALNPYNHIYYNNRAVAQTKLGQFDAAIADAKASIKVNSNYSKSHYRLGLCYMELQQWAEAKTALTTAERVAKANNETAMVSEINNKLTAVKQKLAPQSAGNGGGMDLNALLGGLGGAGGANLQQMLGGMDLNAMLSNPMVQNMMGALGGQGGQGGAPDLSGLMSNPMMQQMMGSLMGGAQQQQGNMGDDDDYEEDGDYYDEDDEAQQQ